MTLPAQDLNNTLGLIDVLRAAESLCACMGDGEHLTDSEREGLGYLRHAINLLSQQDKTKENP